MSGPDVMFPEEQQQMTMVCQRLARDANAKSVLLIGRDGQPLHSLRGQNGGLVGPGHATPRDDHN